MLDILADSQRFSSETKLLFNGIEGRDNASGMVGAIEVPGVEARKVLKRSEEFVTTNCEGRSESVQRSKRGKERKRERH